jgi:hypothetical protein
MHCLGKFTFEWFFFSCPSWTLNRFIHIFVLKKKEMFQHKDVVNLLDNKFSTFFNENDDTLRNSWQKVHTQSPYQRSY